MSITKLDIPRALWGRGSLLISRNDGSNDGRMCCLGHLALACGVSKANLLHKVMPSDLTDPDIKLLPLDFQLLGILGGDSKTSNSAAGINDSSDYQWPDKEDKLVELFDKVGIELTFSGPPDYPV